MNMPLAVYLLLAMLLGILLTVALELWLMNLLCWGGLFIRHRTLILLSYLLCCELYPHFNPRIGERKAKIFSLFFPPTFFLFSVSWVRYIPPTTAPGEGRPVESRMFLPTGSGAHRPGAAGGRAGADGSRSPSTQGTNAPRSELLWGGRNSPLMILPRGMSE